MRVRRTGARLLALAAGAACVAAASATVAIAVEDGARGADAASAGPAAAERIARQLEADDGSEESITDISPPPRVSASSWIVYDSGADEPIAAQDPATARPIASLVKLMTALVVVDRIQLDAKVTIPASVNELGADAARMDARAGEQWPARDLLRAMLAHSANDAAIALAEHVADGDRAAFVRLMNEQAEQLGMSDTEFASATGLDAPGEASTSTPIDIVALSRAALQEETIREAVAERTIMLRRPDGGGTIELPNRNPLLGAYPGVDGVKTGFTDAAGYMLVAHHVDEETNGDVLVVTVASTSEATRVSDGRALLDWARSLRVQLRLVEGGTPYATIPVQRSDERIEVFACDDLVVTARVGQDVTQEVVVPRSVAAPVRTGDEIGELRARIGTPVDEDAARLPETVALCSGTDVESRDRIDRVLDYARDYRAAWRSGIEEVEDTWSSIMEAAA